MSATVMGRHLFSRAVARDGGTAGPLAATLLAHSPAMFGAFLR